MSELPHSITIHDLLRHSDWVRTLAQGLLYDKSMTEDVVQEVWAAAIKNPPKSQYAISAWLKKVVRSIAYRSNQSVLRQSDIEKAESSLETTSSDELAQSPDELAIRIETQKQLLDSVLTLKEPYRTVVHLHYYREMRLTEIAEITGVPPSTVRTRLSRALEQLRTHLSEATGSKKKFCALLLPMLPRSDLEAMFTAAADQALGISGSSALSSTIQELGSRSTLATEVSTTVTLKSAGIALAVTLGVVLSSLMIFNSPSDPPPGSLNSKLALSPSHQGHQEATHPQFSPLTLKDQAVTEEVETVAQVLPQDRSVLEVRDSQTQDLLSNVEVFAIRLTQASVIPLGTTDPDGTLRIDPSILKRDALLLFKDGYLLHREAAALRKIEDGRFTIALESSIPAQIELTYADGSPASGVSVKLEVPVLKIDKSKDRTLPSSTFESEVKRSAAHFVSDSDGRVRYSYWHPDTRVHIQHESFVELSVKAKTPSTRLKLIEGKEVVGRLLSSEGKPVQESQVELTSLRNSALRKFTSGEDGRFDLGRIDPEDKLTLTFHHPDWPSYRVQGQPKANEEWLIRLPHGAPLYGRVLAPDGSPAVGGYVFVMEHHIPQPKTQAALEGEVVSSVKGVPIPKRGRSQYRLKTIDRAKIDHDGWFQLKPQPDREEPRYLWVYHPLYVNHLELLPSSIGQGEISIVLKKGTEISGKLIRPTGQPIAGALLHLGEIWSHDVESILGRTKTNEDGTFRLIGVPEKIRENLKNRLWSTGVSKAQFGSNERTAIFVAAFPPDELLSLNGMALNESEIWKGFSVQPGESDLQLVAAHQDHGVSLDIFLRSPEGSLVNILCPAILIDPEGKPHRGQIGRPLGNETRIGHRFYTDHPLKDLSVGRSQLFLMPQGYRWELFDLESLQGREQIEITLQRVDQVNQAGLRLQNPLGDPVERRILFIKIPGVAASLNFSSDDYLSVGISNKNGEIDLSFLGAGSYEIIAGPSLRDGPDHLKIHQYRVETEYEALGSLRRSPHQQLSPSASLSKQSPPEVSGASLDGGLSGTKSWETRTLSEG